MNDFVTLVRVTTKSRASHGHRNTTVTCHVVEVYVDSTTTTLQYVQYDVWFGFCSWYWKLASSSHIEIRRRRSHFNLKFKFTGMTRMMASSDSPSVWLLNIKTSMLVTVLALWEALLTMSPPRAFRKNWMDVGVIFPYTTTQGKHAASLDDDGLNHRLSYQLNEVPQRLVTVFLWNLKCVVRQMRPAFSWK